VSYCPKCGNKVDETMTFCPRCGASLKMETSWQSSPAPASTTRPPVRNEKQEKGEKGEKQEKHEKGGGGYFGWFIAGMVIIFIGLIAFANSTMHFLNSAASSAVVLLVIGVLIVAVGVYFSSKARSRNPAPT